MNLFRCMICGKAGAQVTHPRTGSPVHESCLATFGQASKPATAGWISVKDRLPENDDNVIVARDEEVFVAFWDKQDWISCEWRMCVPPPTHWQPLPEPPNKEAK